MKNIIRIIAETIIPNIVRRYRYRLGNKAAKEVF